MTSGVGVVTGSGVGVTTGLVPDGGVAVDSLGVGVGVGVTAGSVPVGGVEVGSVPNAGVSGVFLSFFFLFNRLFKSSGAF